jgi:hypothetical protein
MARRHRACQILCRNPPDARLHRIPEKIDTTAETQNHVSTNMKAEIAMEVDHSQKRATTVWRGDFDMAAIASSCQKRIAEGAHRYPQIVDATEATVVRQPREVRSVPLATLELAKQSQKSGMAGPTAVIVSSQADFGMCRAISAYFEPAGEIAVFYSKADAEQWLSSVTSVA